MIMHRLLAAYFYSVMPATIANVSSNLELLDKAKITSHIIHNQVKCRMENKNLTILAIAPLFLVLFIDGMGLGLLFPILNSIIVDPSSTFLSAELSSSTRSLIYGAIISVFMICWFFGAAILGDLSDCIGRKKSLTICLVGTFLGYLISGIGVIGGSLSLLIIGRVIAGFTAGSQPIAQAAIVDISREEHKTKNIGLILLAVSLGFVVGPMLGGFLSDPHLVSWFNYSTPLYFAAGIALLNAILLQWFFKETFVATRAMDIRLTYAVTVVASAFKHSGVRYLSLILLVMIVGWSNYFGFLAMFLLKRYAFSAMQISIFMAIMAGGFSLGFGFLVNFFNNRFKEKPIIVGSYITAAMAITLTILTDSYIFAGLLTILVGASVSVGYSTIISVFSSAVGPHEQGWVMGVTGSIMALCFGITSFITGAIADYSANLPMILAAGPLFISGILMAYYQKPARKLVTAE
jgi:DHA1 family tetracycline resistance protein-like MFS transporter